MSGPGRSGEYYAQGGTVWKSPVYATRAEDGGTTITVGFPVCTMTDAAGPEAAEVVAALMNLGTSMQQKAAGT